MCSLWHFGPHPFLPCDVVFHLNQADSEEEPVVEEKKDEAAVDAPAAKEVEAAVDAPAAAEVAVCEQ